MRKNARPKQSRNEKDTNVNGLQLGGAILAWVVLEEIFGLQYGPNSGSESRRDECKVLFHRREHQSKTQQRPHKNRTATNNDTIGIYNDY